MCPADRRSGELDLIVITKKKKKQKEYHVETFLQQVCEAACGILSEKKFFFFKTTFKLNTSNDAFVNCDIIQLFIKSQVITSAGSLHLLQSC